MICSSVNRERFMVRPYNGPDSNSTWREISGAGHILQDGTTFSSFTADWSYEELLSEHGRVTAKLQVLRDEFKQQELELQQRLRAVRLELRMRGPSAK
jgi:hypothetical protein